MAKSDIFPVILSQTTASGKSSEMSGNQTFNQRVVGSIPTALTIKTSNKSMDLAP